MCENYPQDGGMWQANGFAVDYDFNGQPAPRIGDALSCYHAEAIVNAHNHQIANQNRCIASLRAELERVTQERDELIKDKVDRQGEEIGCLYEIRKIFEDTPGKMMQDELVAHIRAEVESLRNLKESHEAILDLDHRCSLRATELYRERYPDYPELSIPDGADELAELLAMLTEARAEVERLRDADRIAWAFCNDFAYQDNDGVLVLCLLGHPEIRICPYDPKKHMAFTLCDPEKARAIIDAARKEEEK